MTSNQLKNAANKVQEKQAATAQKQADTARAAQKETARYNAKREKAQNFKDFTAGAANIAGNVVGAAGTVGKLIAANDPSWYTQDKQLTADAGSLSFGRPAGIPITTADNVDYRIPYACTYKFIPTLGSGQVADVTAKNVYAFVRYKNSGSSNYDAPDLMMYLLAMDTLYTLWAEGRRLYGALRYVNSMNRSSQRNLIHALGFDYDDLVTHIVDLRYYLNQLKLRLAAFYIPKDITYYQRHMWLAVNVFADDNLQKSQWHAFVPGVYFVYDEADGCLVPYRKGDFLKFSDFKTIVENAMVGVVSSESIGIMSGDILKAYGSEGTVSLSPVTEDVVLEIIYSDEVLEQINNASVFKDETDETDTYQYGFWIYQDADGHILQGYRSQAIDPFLSKKPVISTVIDATNVIKFINHNGPLIWVSKEDQPSPDRVFTMTRLSALAVREHKDGLTRLEISHCGSEVILGAKVWFESAYGPSYDIQYDGRIAGTVITLGQYFTNLSVFENFPMIRFANTVPASTQPTAVATKYVGENLIYVYRDTLEKLHNVALMSEFGLPYTESLNKPSLR